MENLVYKPTVYEGGDPYICVSFHPSDREKILGILELLENRGFRFWLNDCVPPGADADETIAEHIENSEFFVAFVSAAYLESLDMLDELNFSRDTGKEYLLVYLEDVTLPYGLDMRFMRAQSINARTLTSAEVYSQMVGIAGVYRFYGIADEKLRPKAEKLFEELAKFYPEHKVFALDAVAKQLSKSISELYIQAGYSSAERLMLDYGFTPVGTGEARTLRSGVVYQPGYEPEIVKSRIDYIMNTLAEAFPNRTISGSLENSHKAIYRSLLGLSVWLGYASVADMLTAYGFTSLFSSTVGRTAIDYGHTLSLIEERYAERQKPTTLSKLQADNPDLVPAIKTLSNRSGELFGMSLLRYLRQKGLVGIVEKEKSSTKTALNRQNIIARIVKLYADSDGSYGSFEDAIGLDSVILKENARGRIYAASSGNCLGILRLPLGMDYIGAEAFAGEEEITQLILPPTLKEIREGAFIDCCGIKSIVFSEGIERIDDNAFANCSALESVVFPASLKHIGSEAFSGCSALEDVKFGNPRISIREDAFEDCIFKLDDLRNEAASPAEYFELSVGKKNTAKITAYTGDEEVVIIPPMIAGHPIQSIEKGCFKDNTYVREIYIDDNIEAISGDAFKDCVNLEKVHISNAVSKFTSSAFAGCTALSEANIPDSMTEVPRGLFKDSPLTTIHIGKGVKNLSTDAFYKGTADFASGLYFKEKVLEKLTVDEGNEYFSTIGTMLLSKDGKILIAELGDPAVAEIPEGVVEIAPSAFEKIGSFSEVHFPSSLKKIGEKAFAGTGLTHVELPPSVESIGMQAFSFCRGLSSVEFYDGLKVISQQAFEGCPIQDVYIPASVEKLGTDSFLAISTYQGQLVPTFRIDSFNTSLIADGIALYKATDNGYTLLKAYSPALRPLPNTELPEPTHYTVKARTTAIAPHAFARAAMLESIALPEGLLTIGDMAFWDCNRLAEIHIPESCTAISPKAFFGINVKQI